MQATSQAENRWDFDHLLIGGKWQPAEGGRTYEVPNPATERSIGRAPDASVADMKRAIEVARKAFDEGPW
ncbi:MAG: aldehyde dehydrogenase family protein, partial [Alphaproteobacteria bacterium]